jgi:DHA2 family multidrug resistance protein
MWNNRTILHHVRLTEQASVDNPLFNQSISSTQSLLQMDPQSAHALFDYTVNTQAAIMGLDDFFYASSFIFILIIPLIWVTRPMKGRDAADAAAGSH